MIFHTTSTYLVSQVEALKAENDALRKDAASHKRAAGILVAALQLVREYPDFDDAPDGTRNLFADVMDMALRQEVHPALSMIERLTAR